MKNNSPSYTDTSFLWTWPPHCVNSSRALTLASKLCTISQSFPTQCSHTKWFSTRYCVPTHRQWYPKWNIKLQQKSWPGAVLSFAQITFPRNPMQSSLPRSKRDAYRKFRILVSEFSTVISYFIVQISPICIIEFYTSMYNYRTSSPFANMEN